MAKQTTKSAAPTTVAGGNDKYNVRRWRKPSERAKGYAEERKMKVHKYGKKADQPLNDCE